MKKVTFVVPGRLTRLALLSSFATALAAWVHAQAGTFSTDFNAGLPPGTSVYGTAVVDSSGGVGDSGVLKLTTALLSQQGSFLIADLDGGAPIASFVATFQMLIGGGNGADGVSFNFANDLPDDSFGEEGAGTGLSIAFDTFNNGNGEAPAIDVKSGGVTIASVKGILDLVRLNDFVDVSLSFSADNKLDLTVNGYAVYSGLFVPFIPTAGRFGLGARTGGLSDNHFVDNLTITTTTGLPAQPVVRLASPQGNLVRGDTLVSITIQDGLSALEAATVQLSFDGASVTPILSKSGSLTVLQYDPPGLLPPGSAHVATVSFSGSGVPAARSTFSFSFGVANYVGPNGNYYEFVQATGIPWEQARLAAEQRRFCGAPGHLATITSPEEDVYLENLRQLFVQESGLSLREFWAGGFQPPDQPTPGDGWMWVNNEGPIEGFNGGNSYANWFPGDPNDCCNSTGFEDNEENHLGIGLFRGLGWNDDDHLGNIQGYVVEYEQLVVSIDIKPGDSPNVVYLNSNGKLPVAILSSATFDAAIVDPTTVRFGRTGTEASPVSHSFEDVNQDGRQDLVCQFNTPDAGLMCGDTVAWLRAATREGCPLKGQDTIQTLGCPPYELTVRALQDVRQLTDVYLNVCPTLSGYTAPTLAKHIQLQSFDIFGQLRWTKNADNVALTADAANCSSADLQYSDMARYQRVKAQMQVPNSQGSTTLVLRGEGVVLLRPDLTVDNVSAPGTINARQIVNLAASIKELNGDLGATATVYLMEGGNVLDVAGGIPVQPHGNVGVVFSAIFSQAGTHELKVVIGDVIPGDYDTSNNEKSFTVEVQQEPAFHYASYYHADFEYLSESDNPYWTSRYYEKGQSEDLHEELYIPVALNFPVERLTLQISANGTLKNDVQLTDLPADFAFTNGDCYAYATVFRTLGDGFSLYLQSIRDTCGGGNYQQTYASFDRQAFDYIYFSSYHDKYWGTTYEDSGAPNLGDLLNATSSLAVRFVVEDDGAAYGGTADLSLYSYPYDYDWNYVYPDWGYDRGYSRGTQTYGSSSGYLTP